MNEEEAKVIDWEKRRYEVAKEVLPEVMRQIFEMQKMDILKEPSSYEDYALASIDFADELIKQLKKKKNCLG